MPTEKPKVVVVMPAYNAQHTIEKTWREVVAHDVVDLVIIVDDASQDDTVKLARGLDRVMVHVHPKNRGYGGNQKTCYALALSHGADVVVMVHPDYQYTPKLIPAMAGMVSSGLYGCVLGSRILGGGALAGGMPLWRYVANRFLTLAGNILLGTKVSEFHTGYRAFSRELLEALPLDANSDDFVFDNQMLAAGGVAGVSDRRGVVPDAVRAGCLVDQFRPQREVRLRLPQYRGAVPAGEMGPAAIGALPRRSASRLQHLAPARELSKKQQQERHEDRAHREERGTRAQHHGQPDEHREQHRREAARAIKTVDQAHADRGQRPDRQAHAQRAARVEQRSRSTAESARHTSSRAGCA